MFQQRQSVPPMEVFQQSESRIGGEEETHKPVLEQVLRQQFCWAELDYLDFWQRIMITILLLIALILRVHKQPYNFNLKIVGLQKDLCRKCLWSQI